MAKQNRLTEAELEAFDAMTWEDGNYASEVLALIAEVRRLRGLISQAFPDESDGLKVWSKKEVQAQDAGHAALVAEARAIREEKKTT